MVQGKKKGITYYRAYSFRKQVDKVQGNYQKKKKKEKKMGNTYYRVYSFHQKVDKVQGNYQILETYLMFEFCRV